MTAAFLLGAAILAGGAAPDQDKIVKGKIEWTTDHDAAFKRAAKEDKLVLVHFWATW